MTLDRKSANLNQVGRVILRDRGGLEGDRWLSFRHPQETLSTFEQTEVLDLLAEVEATVQQGIYAAGYVSYEAAAAFDSALSVHPPREGLPLIWFGLFKTLEELDSESLDREPRPAPASSDLADSPIAPLSWDPSVSEGAYRRSLGEIFSQISAGETYQINYTFQLRSAFEGDPWNLFTALLSQQRQGYHAYIDTGSQVICSASPELFFSLDGESILCRPMKGTAPRGRTVEEDSEQARFLVNSPKERAENVMIVDMIRNDLGQIAVPGTVSTSSLFDIEKYETVHQMTSTVAAKTGGSLSDIFQALFPCASITGAPKVRATQLIRDLEKSARGIYTGAIGFVLPSRSGRRAQFNVAIRTIHVDRRGHTGSTASFGTGSGIVWDSDPSREYRECQIKALLLRQPEAEFSLLETMLFTPARGVRLRSRHLARLADSAVYFDFEVNIHAVEEELDRVISNLSQQPARLRLTLDRHGRVSIDAQVVEPIPKVRGVRGPLKVGWAKEPVDSTSKFLFHKTTCREVYTLALKHRPDCDDVLLWNERGEVTESCRANLIVERHGRLTTPPLSSGLLPGTLRAELLQRGRIHEQLITKEEIELAERVFLINSVRGWARVSLTPVRRSEASQ